MEAIHQDVGGSPAELGIPCNAAAPQRLFQEERVSPSPLPSGAKTMEREQESGHPEAQLRTGDLNSCSSWELLDEIPTYPPEPRIPRDMAEKTEAEAARATTTEKAPSSPLSAEAVKEALPLGREAEPQRTHCHDMTWPGYAEAVQHAGAAEAEDDLLHDCLLLLSSAGPVAGEQRSTSIGIMGSYASGCAVQSVDTDSSQWSFLTAPAEAGAAKALIPPRLLHPLTRGSDDGSARDPIDTDCCPSEDRASSRQTAASPLPFCQEEMAGLPTVMGGHDMLTAAASLSSFSVYHHRCRTENGGGAELINGEAPALHEMPLEEKRCDIRLVNQEEMAVQYLPNHPLTFSEDLLSSTPLPSAVSQTRETVLDQLNGSSETVCSVAPVNRRRRGSNGASNSWLFATAPTLLLMPRSVPLPGALWERSQWTGPPATPPPCAASSSSNVGYLASWWSVLHSNCTASSMTVACYLSRIYLSVFNELLHHWYPQLRLVLGDHTAQLRRGPHRHHHRHRRTTGIQDDYNHPVKRTASAGPSMEFCETMLMPEYGAYYCDERFAPPPPPSPSSCYGEENSSKLIQRCRDFLVSLWEPCHPVAMATFASSAQSLLIFFL